MAGAETHAETSSSRTIVFDTPGWPGAPPGQHVDMRLTAEDGYSTRRSYSIVTPADGVQTYVCGPTGFVEAVVGKLTLSGLDPAHIRTERFG